MTNNDLFEPFRDHTERNYCKNTYSGRISAIKCHFLPICGEKEVNLTTTADINDVYDSMEAEGYAQNTIYGVSSALMSYFRYAIDNGVAAYSPVRDARKIPQGV